MTLIATDKKTIVIGMGVTGLSCARFLTGLGKSVVVMDTRAEPPGLAKLKADVPQVDVYTGELNASLLAQADEIVVSPGVPVSSPEIQAAKDNGVRVRGDIDVFAEFARAPIVGITGSNGKSTVTTIVGEMARESGVNVAVGGNIGVPALDLIDDSVELYVLELSSFQLETTSKLGALCAVVLNISEDHMDRYPNKMAYLQAKQRIFNGCKKVVVNDDEPLSQPLMAVSMEAQHFGIKSQDLNKFSILQDGEGSWLCFGFDRLMKVERLKIKGTHNVSNALAALSIGRSAGLRTDAMLTVLQDFEGLKHRCQWVKEINGVQFINDSKGTNVGATQAAINSLGDGLNGKIVLIAGGEGKGADFAPLSDVMQRFGKAAVLIGTDAKKIASNLVNSVSVYFADSLKQAVNHANDIASEGDMVLFSPACASFDMFENYQDRGEKFMAEVHSI